jgi:hypothetical protein
MEKVSNPGRIRFLVTVLSSVFLLNGCMLSFAQRTDDGVAKTRAVVSATPQQPVDVVLAELSALPAGQALQLASGETAIADVPYFAASGRECRFVEITPASGGGNRRLACLTGVDWAWQRNVLPR